MNKHKIIAERKREQGRLRQKRRRERLRLAGKYELPYAATKKQHEILKQTLNEMQNEANNA